MTKEKLEQLRERFISELCGEQVVENPQHSDWVTTTEPKFMRHIVATGSPKVIFDWFVSEIEKAEGAAYEKGWKDAKKDGLEINYLTVVRSKPES